MTWCMKAIVCSGSLTEDKINYEHEVRCVQY